jgi:uncharacterized Zn finger protein (UPF0148 family)
MMKSNRKVLLRACPRCSGDLFPDEDDFACLQCGRRVEAVQVTDRPVIERPQAPALAA